MEEVAAINQAEMQRKQNRTQLIAAGIGAVGQIGGAYLGGLGKRGGSGGAGGGGGGTTEFTDMSGVTIGYDGPDFGVGL